MNEPASRTGRLGLSLVLLAAALAGCSREDPDKVWLEAEEDLRAGRFAPAEKGLATLERLRSPTARDWMLRGQIALARKRTDQALTALHHLKEGEPLAAQARLLEGQVELRRGRMRIAEERLREAVRLDPRLVQAHRELVYIYGVQLRRQELRREFRILSELSNLTYDNVFHWCLTRSTLWEPVELAEMMARFVKADPSDRWSRLTWAESLRRLGLLDKADEALRPLPDSDPEARAIRVRIALDRGETEKAMQLLADGPDDQAELARLRGRMALARRDGAAAVRYFRAAFAAEPDDRDTLFGLAGALRMVGKDAEAASYAEAARAHDALAGLVQRAATPSGREDPALPLELGAACEAIQRWPEARAWYKLVIARNPLDAGAQRALFRVEKAISAEKDAGKKTGS